MRPLARPRSLPALVVTIIVMSADVLEDDVLYLPGFADQSIHKRVLPTAEVQTPCDDCSMNTAAPSQARSAGNARGVIVLFDHMDRLGREHPWYSFSHHRFRWGIRRKLDNIADGKRISKARAGSISPSFQTSSSVLWESPGRIQLHTSRRLTSIDNSLSLLPNLL